MLTEKTMKHIWIWMGCMLASLAASAQLPVEGVEHIEIGGFVGNRIRLCMERRVKAQPVGELVEPFRHLTEGKRWQSEFLGKWMLGAIGMYEYCGDQALRDSIDLAARQLMATQRADGYIGNYKPEDRLTQWDIWGRKYTALSLLAYHRLTHDAEALATVRRLIDGLMKELADKRVEIAATGNYRGMASCSVLEPVVWLYRATGEPRYLEFARQIVRSMESPAGAGLVAKALADVPVAQRFPHPAQWWSAENGQKAYEMMSCYEGLMELGHVTGDPLYLEAARRAADNIRATEINIAGGGAAFECWYGGKARQTRPAYHTMETCVTFTWMQFCARLLRATGQAFYADEFERTMYNALMASMKADGTQISKYSPLEGRRHPGEQQCGMRINCCNANGPRGFALIPRTACHVRGKCVYINLYLPAQADLQVERRRVNLSMETRYPQDGNVRITVSPEREDDFTVALRIPAWAGNGYAVAVNGEPQPAALRGGYLYLHRRWRKQDTIDIDFKLQTRVATCSGAQAVVHGPLVFARDSRFADGDVDECAVIQRGKDGTVKATLTDTSADSFAWLTLAVPMVLGTDLENEGNKQARPVRFCDFGSAGNDWSTSGRYRVWIPETLHVMSEPYRAY